MATIQLLQGTEKIKDSYGKINTSVTNLNNAKMEKTADSDLNMNNRSVINILKLNLRDQTTLTISNGAITVTQGYHTVDTEGGAPQDELTTINGGSIGDRLLLRQANTDRKVTIKGDGSGNIYTFDRTDIALDSVSSVVELIKINVTGHWYVIGINGVKRAGDTMTGRLQIANQLYYGTGSPQGNLAASPGSIYQNLSGGNGTTLYYKASGTGNTGWVAIA
jgi:hypothetical protein